jgi:hypothetical protein
MAEQTAYDPEDLKDTLQEALAKDFGSDKLPNPGGWAFSKVGVQFLMSQNVPVAVFKKGDTSLSFIVTPTDASQQCFARSKNYDVTYFSTDVADDKQDDIWSRDQGMIEAFAAWIRAWDGVPG